MIDSKSGGGGKNYYDLPPNSEQLLDLIEHVNMNGNIKDIFKACYRLGRKKGVSREYDLRKMALYSLRELGRELGRKDYMTLAEEVIGHHDTVTEYKIGGLNPNEACMAKPTEGEKVLYRRQQANAVERWIEDSVFDLFDYVEDGSIKLTDSRQGKMDLIFKDYDQFFRWFIVNCTELYLAKGGSKKYAAELLNES